MTTKKSNGHVEPTGWTLSLLSQEELEQESLRAFRLARDEQRVLSKEEQRMANEGNKHLLSMEYNRQKIQVALEDARETHSLSGQCIYETAVHHDGLLQASAGTSYEGMMRQVVHYDLESLTRQTQKLMEVYTLNLVTEMTRQLYIKDEPETITKEVIKEVPKEVIVEVPQKGVFRKLFG